MNILIDTDVILDLFLDREPFANDAEQLWEYHLDGKIVAHISAMTPVNAFYIIRKLHTLEVAQNSIQVMIDTLNICHVTHATLISAANSAFSDFEDAVQHECALDYQLDAIVTRNIKDYKEATIPVLLPTDFLDHLN